MADAFFDELETLPPTEESEEPEKTSFTFDDGGDRNVLELVKYDGNEKMFYRDNKEWLEVQKDDDLPGLYDKDIVDIAPKFVDKAIKLFDEGNDLSKADVETLLQVK